MPYRTVKYKNMLQTGVQDKNVFDCDVPLIRSKLTRLDNNANKTIFFGVSYREGKLELQICQRYTNGRYINVFVEFAVTFFVRLL